MWSKALKAAQTPPRQKLPVTHPKQNVVMTKTVAAATVTAIAIVVNEVSAPSKLKAAIKLLQPRLATIRPLS